MTSVASPSSFLDAVTIRQKLNILEAWRKSQENELMLEKARKNSSGKQISNSNSSSRRNLSECNEFAKIEEQPLMPAHVNFEALIDAKLKEANVQNNTEIISTDKQIQKKPFLKKGQGLSRFRMKPEDFKLKDNDSSHSKQKLVKPTQHHSSDKSDSLQAFETLEEQANNSSFCSTSSMVEQLMEDSIKSTPIKKDNPPNEQCLRVLQEQYARTTQNLGDMLQNYEYYGIRRLDIIDEEPSKLEDSKPSIEESSHPNVNDFNINNTDECSSDDQSDNETSSKCSCCQDNNNYLSTSVSVYEETTTVYSPIKNTLQNRLKELESEIDAFRSENAHLSKLRSEYEAEYNKFCEEKTQILKKIREEHITELKELEKEKKNLQREKIAFEKYLKEGKHRTSKEEKEEIRLLKEEIKNLKEKMNEKEGRWAAAQARIRTEMKQLKDHNTKLKEEVEKLRKSSKSVSFAPLKKSKSSSSILRRIDNELEKTQKTVQQFQSPPTSPDSGLDDTKVNENDSRERYSESMKPELIQRTSGDVSDEEKRIVESKALEIYDDYGNREKLYADGRKEIWYPNGNVKKISADGKVIKTIYYNGDVKEISTDLKMVKYFYAESKIWHSEYEDGHEIMEFPNGQVEKRYKGQSVEVIYPNGTVYSMTASGDKKWVHSDGTTIVHYADKNEKKIFFSNKQIETHTPEYKKREFPDGTIKTIYINGMQETKYPNGRVRLKTKDGRLLSDSEVT